MRAADVPAPACGGRHDHRRHQDRRTRSDRHVAAAPRRLGEGHRQDALRRRHDDAGHAPRARSCGARTPTRCIRSIDTSAAQALPGRARRAHARGRAGPESLRRRRSRSARARAGQGPQLRRRRRDRCRRHRGDRARGGRAASSSTTSRCRACSPSKTRWRRTRRASTTPTTSFSTRRFARATSPKASRRPTSSSSTPTARSRWTTCRWSRRPGLAYVDSMGVLNILTATQYPFRDRRQIAPNVGLPMNKRARRAWRRSAAASAARTTSRRRSTPACWRSRPAGPCAWSTRARSRCSR